MREPGARIPGTIGDSSFLAGTFALFVARTHLGESFNWQAKMVRVQANQILDLFGDILIELR